MSDQPERIGSRLFDACVAVLLGAMALYGAVVILKAIWVPLCITLTVMVVCWLLFQFLSRRW